MIVILIDDTHNFFFYLEASQGDLIESFMMPLSKLNLDLEILK